MPPIDELYHVAMTHRRAGRLGQAAISGEFRRMPNFAMKTRKLTGTFHIVNLL